MVMVSTMPRPFGVHRRFPGWTYPPEYCNVCLVNESEDSHNKDLKPLDNLPEHLIG
jgi:hypothetical protein